MKHAPFLILILFLSFQLGNAQYVISGELKKWHKVTITFDGPSTSETADPNPFTNYRLNVTFSKDGKSYLVPGYYAADGNAANTSASSGNKWRVHFSPDEEGAWNFTASFRTGNLVAVSDDPNAGQATGFDGASGTFQIGPTDKTGRDHRGKGRLQYVGERYLKFAETNEYFLKVGADAPENFLAYEDFDNTPNYGNLRKSWNPHLQDWQNGDPDWQSGKGKEIIGAINYLASEEQNVFSFLTMNINGDDKNVFPYISDSADDRMKMDCSKLDQWEIVFEHADRMGMYMHFKTQETENSFLLDFGNLGNQRKFYYRELIARFAHHLALNWNIGEENNNSNEQRKAFAKYFHDHDPYQHHIVIHTYPWDYDEVYGSLIGSQSDFTGASMQVSWPQAHTQTLTWLNNSQQAGQPWVIATDEQSSANVGVPHDDYTGTPTQANHRKAVLWGNLMAGGAGVEYYFGYELPHSDLTCQDFRSRDQMWDYNRYAHGFFMDNVPFWDMDNHNELIGNNSDNNDKYCLAKPGQTYVIFLANGGTTNLNLQNYGSTYSVFWFNPVSGGSLQTGSVPYVTGPGEVSIGNPPNASAQDWAVLITTDQIECADAGTPCNDGDPSTFDDVEDGDCNCEGTACPPAGTPCDDGNPETENDAQNGFCQCIGTVPGDTARVWLEAECGEVGANWSTPGDANASNGTYALPPNFMALSEPPTDVNDKVIFNFSVAQAGEYWIYARTLTTSDGDDSFWVRVNEGPWQNWNKINADNYGNFYQWDQVGDWAGGNSSDPVTFQLNAGNNTLEFGRREPNARLDKILISNEPLLPDGLGQAAVNCGCPPAGTPCDDGDPTTDNDVEDGNCNCVGTDCPPVGTPCDDGNASTENDVEDGDCNCVGTPCPPAGTACDDGDPSTDNDVEDGNCNCVGADCPSAGTPCDDGDASTENDVEDGDCNCVGTPCPPAGTACDDGDPSTDNDVEDGNCNCVGADCPPAGTPCDDGNASTENDVEDGNCNCVGTPCPPAGTACDDGDPSTDNDVEDGNCNCVGADCPPAGTPCDDGNASTENDVEDGDCNCAGTPCPPAGTACDDGDPSTDNDVEDGNCNCAGTACPPAGTPCDDGNASTENDVEDGDCNCAGTPCPPAGTACDDGDPATDNDVEDGNCNCAGTACPPAGTPCDDGDPATENDTEDGNCNCIGSACPPAGTPCDDGDPMTENDIEDGDCNCMGTAPGDVIRFWLEAECGNLGDEWTVASDILASEGSYALSPGVTGPDNPPTDVNDMIVFEVGVPEAGEYWIYGRTMTTNDGDDSFWVQVNEGPWQKWNKINADNYGDIYQWEQVGHWLGGNSSDPVTFQFNAGSNTIVFGGREANARLDKVLVSNEPFLPDDMGQPAENCACPDAGTPCDDDDPSTYDDTEDGDCNCVGTACPPAGTPCDDGDPATENDTEDGNCNCIGSACPPAGTVCDDGDPATYDDVEDGDCNCMGTACPLAGTPCDDGDPATENDVEDGYCQCSGTVPGDSTRVWLEAECADVGANWTEEMDVNASNEAYVLPPAGNFLDSPPTSAEDKIFFNFSVPEGGDYRVYGRTMTTNDNDDSFWVRIDEGEWHQWNKINANNYGNMYQWEQVGDWLGGNSSEPITFPLDAGDHILEFACREPNARLDKVLIALDSSLPEGFGQPAGNCGPMTLALDQGQQEHSFVLFPNPTTGGLTIRLLDAVDHSTIVSGRIVNSLGQLVQTVEVPDRLLENSFRINIGHLKPGTYTMFLETREEIHTGVFVKI